jgi:hypothetical protein
MRIQHSVKVRALLIVSVIPFFCWTIQTSLRSIPISNTHQESSTIDNVLEFHGIHLTFIPQKSVHSTVHCVGDNFRHDAWYYRSCEFRNLCFNITDQQFFLASTPAQVKLEEALSMRRNKYGLSSTTVQNSGVAYKALQHTFFDTHFAGPSWFPTLKPFPQIGYYEFPSNVIFIPLRSLNVNVLNPGHLIWDYFLPIFTLLSMFGLENSKIPFIIDHNRHCTQIKDSINGCFSRINKFLPLLGYSAVWIENSAAVNKLSLLLNPKLSDLVCFPYSVAGTGMLHDHGRGKHGNLITDYQNVRNIGRGPELFRFRKFMLRNIGVTENQNKRELFRIVVSMNASNNPSRRQEFKKQRIKLEDELGNQEVIIQPLVLASLSLKDQISTVSQASVFITVMGGNSVFATFLPRGSSLIIYFNDKDEWIYNVSKELQTKETRVHPMMMDWDLLNNAAYLNVHWFPMSIMDEESELQIFIATIQNEISKKKKNGITT